jgi:hypothetical protein
MNIPEIVAAHAIWAQKFYGTKTKGEQYRQEEIRQHMVEFTTELLDLYDYVDSKKELHSLNIVHR